MGGVLHTHARHEVIEAIHDSQIITFSSKKEDFTHSATKYCTAMHIRQAASQEAVPYHL